MSVMNIQIQSHDQEHLSPVAVPQRRRPLPTSRTDNDETIHEDSSEETFTPAKLRILTRNHIHRHYFTNADLAHWRASSASERDVIVSQAAAHYDAAGMEMQKLPLKIRQEVIKETMEEMYAPGCERALKVLSKNDDARKKPTKKRKQVADEFEAQVHAPKLKVQVRGREQSPALEQKEKSHSVVSSGYPSPTSPNTKKKIVLVNHAATSPQNKMSIASVVAPQTEVSAPAASTPPPSPSSPDPPTPVYQRSSSYWPLIQYAIETSEKKRLKVGEIYKAALRIDPEKLAQSPDEDAWKGRIRTSLTRDCWPGPCKSRRFMNVDENGNEGVKNGDWIVVYPKNQGKTEKTANAESKVCKK